MSGNITIENIYASVTISPEAGSSLRSISIKKNGTTYELLSGGGNEHDPGVLPHGEGSFIMAPWINRIRDGRLVTPGGTHELPLNAPPHAIHGLVREREWDVVAAEHDSVQLAIELEEPWPFRGRIEYSISLKDRSLVQTMKLIAADDEDRAFPGSVGWHPWFNTSLGSGAVVAQADVASQWELDNTATASGKLEVTDITKRLQGGTQFKVREVDGCFLMNPDGKVTLTWPELTLSMSGSSEITHFMFYSPEHALCVEPQTCTVDAAQLADRGIGDTGHVLVDRANPLIATTTWSWDK